MGSLWFIPGVMLLGAGVLAVAMVELSAQIDREALVRFPRLFGASADSSRDMLATIAGAMMTVAGVTFSITVLAVAQASSQYTPRILRNFMRDRPSQVTLGTLTGVFVYCLIVMRTIRGAEELLFIPALAVLLAVVLAIAAIGVLIYFIHHIAESLEAAHILARIRHDTERAIDRTFTAAPKADGGAATLEPPEAAWQSVPALTTGYVTHVDPAGLLEWCGDAAVVLRMEHAVGDHVIQGTPLLSVVCSRSVDRDAVRTLNASCGIAPNRTVQQDPVFGFRQMVDIAVKALSPGVNDTTTVIASIDAIGAVLYRLAAREEEPDARIGDGRAQLILRRREFPEIVAIGVDEIRRSADGNVNVLARLLAMLATIAGGTRSTARRAVLRGHADRILAVSERSVPDPSDREQVTAAYGRVLDASG